MYNRSLNETERILATHKDVVVPVKEIWLEVLKQGQLQRFEVPPLIDFTTLLEADDRFEFLPAGEELGENYVEPIEEDEPEYTADIERLGFYSEDRVRLRNIEVTEESEGEEIEDSEEPVVETEINEESTSSSTKQEMDTKARMSGNGRKSEKEEKQNLNKSKHQKTSTGFLPKNKKKARSKK